jgi:hypothetical protein
MFWKSRAESNQARLVLAWSHVLLVPAFVAACRNSRWPHAFLVATVCGASVAMHLRETKHGFPRHWSWAPGTPQRALNADRLVATVAALYFAWYRRPWSLQRDSPLIASALVAATFAFVGERTASTRLYVGCHLVWHAVMFALMWKGAADVDADACAPYSPLLS